MTCLSLKAKRSGYACKIRLAALGSKSISNALGISGISPLLYEGGNLSMVLPYLLRTLDSSFPPFSVGLRGSAPTSSNNLLYASAPRPMPQWPKHVISTGAGGSGASFDKLNHYYED